MIITLCCEPELVRRLGAIRVMKKNKVYDIPCASCLIIDIPEGVYYWPLNEELRFLKIN